MNAAQVHVHERIPFLDRHRQDGAGWIDAGIVDQDAHAAKGGHTLVEEPVDLTLDR
jgi:hypothetical protein